MRYSIKVIGEIRVETYMRLLLLGILFILAGVGQASFAQGGGKAEPNRIKFAAGTSSSGVSGTLRNGQEMEYVFAAAKGQIVTISNATKSQFDFRVFNEEHFSEGDFDSSASYSFEVPEAGDYRFTIRKKATGTRSARFSLRISIK